MIETISRGAQFKGFVSTLGLIIFPFAAIIAVALIIFGSYLGGCISLLVGTAAFFLFLDVRGVQIDHSLKRVRRYKQYMWWKWGEWYPLSDFIGVHLAKDYFVVGVVRTGPSMRRTGITVSTFDVALVNSTNDNNILMSEFEKHADAVAFMNSWAQKLNLPTRDIFRELQQSAVSRRTSRR